MRRRSSRDSGASSTRIGSRPCNSGSRSDGFARWNAPEAMNSTWSVFTGPYLVLTVVPSISGSRSRCTPSRDTSPPRKPPSMVRAATLSISSMNTMPLFSACDTASLVSRSLSSSRSASSCSSSRRAASTVSLRFCVGPPAEHALHHLAEVDHLARRHARNVELADRHAARLRDLDLDLLLLELAVAQHAAEFRARVGGGALADQRGDQPFLRRQLGLRLHLLARGLAQHGDAGLDQVARDAFDVAADIADLGELGRLHLQERRLRQLRQPARDLGLAAAGGADHQDVLGDDLLAHRLRQLLAAPAVAQRDRDRALGVVLADDEAVEFGDDLARRIGWDFHIRWSRV